MTTAKSIAASLRSSWAKLNTRTVGNTVRVARNNHGPVFGTVILDLLPPGWGVQELGAKAYAVRWVG